VRPEQALLAAEVVVKRALGEAGCPDQFVQRRVGVAVGGERFAGAGQQAGAGGFGEFGVAAAGHGSLRLTYIPTVRMLRTIGM
jgi:hypothetical protein